METRDDNTSRWLRHRLATLRPSDDWQPNLACGLSRFREGHRVRHAKERRMLWTAFVMSTIGLTLLVFPATRTLAQRYASACVKLLTSLSNSPSGPTYTNVEYRKPAPDFQLTDAAGTPVSKADLRGKVVLLTFWASRCTTCDTEMSWFREFQQTYGERGLVFLNRQIIVGQDDDLLRLFGGLNAIPTTFLIDRSGRIAVTHGGFCSKSEFDSAITTLLNEPSR